MKNRQIKDLLYEQVALVGKAVASPKRLELLDLLGQCEKTVETLADNAGISVKLASAHLKALRLAHLVATRKDGKYVVYRLADKTVSEFWVQLRSLAEERLVNAQMAVQQFLSGADTLAGYDRRAILEKASHDEIIVIDVRPQEEFQAGHLPYARSLPLAELKKRLAALPKGKDIVAYCRGPYCLMSKEAVELLRRKGYRAFRLEDGVAEWQSAGLPLAQGE